MSLSSAIERVLKRDRILAIAVLGGVIAFSWAYLLAGAGMDMHDMGGMGGMGGMPMRMPWTLSYAVIMLIMWSAMMAAMMLPSAAPMILLYGAIARRRGGTNPAAGWGLFAAAYLVVWALFSVVAVALQFGLEQAALLSPAMKTTSAALAGALLVLAGLYQWTPLKQACLRRCRSPLDFVLSEWREGKGGAFTMGLRHGLYCLGCCWLLMLLLFVGGVMSLAWIAGLALFVLVEKVAPAGHWIGRAAGVALMIWGGATLTAVA